MTRFDRLWTHSYDIGKEVASVRAGKIHDKDNECFRSARQWSSVINGVYKGQARILVEKSGRPVAGVVSAADLERLQRLEEEQAADLATLERISKAFADVPPAEIEAEVDEAVAAGTVTVVS